MTTAGAVLVATLAAAAPVQPPSIADVVRRFVPAEALGLGADETARTCSAVLEVDASDQPLVIGAGYVGPTTAALLILGRGPGGRLQVLAEDAFEGDGKVCELHALDLDGDRRPEILVTVPFGMRGTHWEGRIYRWAPPSPSGTSAERLILAAGGLHDPDPIDVLHDGTGQILQNIVDDDEVIDGPHTGAAPSSSRCRSALPWARGPSSVSTPRRSARAAG